MASIFDHFSRPIQIPNKTTIRGSFTNTIFVSSVGDEDVYREFTFHIKNIWIQEKMFFLHLLFIVTNFAQERFMPNDNLQIITQNRVTGRIENKLFKDAVEPEEVIYLHKNSTTTLISNKVFIQTHPIFKIEPIAFDYNLTIIHNYMELNENQYILYTYSAPYLLNIMFDLNQDERVSYAEVLDAYNVATKDCSCSSFETECKTKSGIDLSLRCGCRDHVPSQDPSHYSPFCYVNDHTHCNSKELIPSSWIPGTYFRDCDDELPPEPYIYHQWYLNLINYPFHEENINGNGIIIGIIDDSFDTNHPDFEGVNELNYDYIEDDFDPSSNNFQHGTAATGIAIAKKNSMGIFGIAYKAKGVGLRLLNIFTSADEQDAYMRHKDKIYIKSCSWGPYDDPHILQDISTRGQSGMLDAIQNGRNGKGTIFVFASGNGGYNKNNCNNDGYVNSMYTIAVASVSARLTQVNYGEECACMIVSAPSSGYGYGMFTTDTVGSPGYSKENYTDDFGGTSASAPIVSGAIALMLQVNPNLHWRDVQEILLFTSRKNEVEHESWITNAAGMNYNPFFGAGTIDIAKAVNVSRNWTNLPDRHTFSKTIYPNLRIEDLSSQTFEIFIEQNVSLEHVELVVNIEHKYRLDLAISVESPSGTVAKLTTPIQSNNSIIVQNLKTGYTPSMDYFKDYSNWPFRSVMTWGEYSNGKWIVRVEDIFPGNNLNTNYIKYLSLRVHGHFKTEAATKQNDVCNYNLILDNMTFWTKYLPYHNFNIKDILTCMTESNLSIHDDFYLDKIKSLQCLDSNNNKKIDLSDIVRATHILNLACEQ
jgi:subtilisin-like proprotein convertase family protein